MTSKPSGPVDRRQQVRATQQRQAALAQRRRTLRQILIIAAVAVVAIGMVATAVVLGSGGGSAAGPSVTATVFVDKVSVPFTVAGSAVRVGRDDAPAKIDLWVDYSCPHCAEFEAANNSRMNALIATGEASVAYHNIRFVTDYGLEAGSAAACVAGQDPNRWVAFNAQLYANHSAETDGWAATEFAELAARAGVGNEAQDCIRDGRYVGWVKANTKAAAKAGVSGTPSLLVNGEKSPSLDFDALVAKVHALAGH